MTTSNFSFFDEYTNTPHELEQVYNKKTSKYNYSLIEIVDKKTREPIIVKKTGEVKLKKKGREEYCDKFQVCYYSPKTGCSSCSHSNYCIFDDERVFLQEDIHLLKEELWDYMNILDAYKRKGDIIYHKDFHEHYNINIKNGCVDVSIVNEKQFLDALDSRVKTVNKNLKVLLRERSRILR